MNDYPARILRVRAILFLVCFCTGDLQTFKVMPKSRIGKPVAPEGDRLRVNPFELDLG